MQVKIVNPIEYPNWDKQMEELDGATIFHTTKWASVLSESYGYRPKYITGFEGGDLVGVLPIMDIKSVFTGKRGVSLPFTDHCGPVFRHPDSVDALWSEAVSCGKNIGWKYIELRAKNPSNTSQSFYDRFFVHTMNIHGNETNMLKGFRSSTKRNIRKAEKSSLKVSVSKNYSELFQFYKLNCITRKKHGLPPQPLLFFKNLFQHVIDKGLGFVVIAKKNEHPIAGAVFLAFGKEGVYKYGASDSRYQNLRANNLVMWTGIQEFIKNGYETFNFGRTECHHKGLLQFKRGWGTEESVIYYYRYDIRSNKFVRNAKTPQSSYPVFSHLPAPALKLLGQILYRHVG
jgi:hypothetical protein